MNQQETDAAVRLQSLVGRTLERIEFAPLGVMFHFSGGYVYWARGGPVSPLAAGSTGDDV